MSASRQILIHLQAVAWAISHGQISKIPFYALGMRRAACSLFSRQEDKNNAQHN